MIAAVPILAETRRYPVNRKSYAYKMSGSGGSGSGAGVDLTLSELQDMATRQQQQIELQQQKLVAKEQRLKFLKQHESSQMASDGERLMQLRQKVEAQELKLKQLRELRGQVNQQRVSNSNLNSELESIKLLFNDKEKELASAVVKVDELTRQLDELRRRNIQLNKVSSDDNAPASAELQRLRKELAMRNKMNDQQNQKLLAQHDILNKRNGEVVFMDRRIEELQMRLRKKRAMQQQQQQQMQIQKQAAQQPRQAVVVTKPAQTRPLSANVAAVEPYIHHEANEVTKDDMYEETAKIGLIPNKMDPRYRTLPYNTKFTHTEPHKALFTHTEHSKAPFTHTDHIKAPFTHTDHSKAPFMHPEHSKAPFTHAEPRKASPVVVETVVRAPEQNNNNSEKKDLNIAGENADKGTVYLSKQPVYSSVSNSNGGVSVPSVYKAETNMSNFAPRPYSAAAGLCGKTGVLISAPVFAPNATTQQKPTYSQTDGRCPNIAASTTTSSSSESVTPVSGTLVPSSSSSRSSSHQKHQQAPPYLNTAFTRTPSPPQVSPTGSGSSRGSNASPIMDAANKLASNVVLVNGSSTAYSRANTSNKASNAAVIRVSAPDRISPSSVLIAPSTVTSLPTTGNVTSAPALAAHEGIYVSRTSSGISRSSTTVTSVSSAMSVLMGATVPSTAAASYKPQYASRSVIANTYMKRLGPKALDHYNKINQLYQTLPLPKTAAAGSEVVTVNDVETVPSGTLSSEVGTVGGQVVGNQYIGTGVPSYTMPGTGIPGYTTPGTGVPVYTTPAFHPASTINAEKFSYKNNTLRTLRRRHSSGENDDLEAKWNKRPSSVAPPDSGQANASPPTVLNSDPTEPVSNRRHSSSSSSDDVKSPNSGIVAPQILRKKGVKSSRSKKHRVSFDPHALLLDASLEGEFELVKRSAKEVPDPSAPNDEGITALHNAICAGHFDIVKFLVKFGVDVNSQDIDGWTPLHCAASCNNLAMVKFLVENGACIYATTLSDHETAAEKCEEDEDGYDGCSEYLYSIQEKLGILNGGEVYALFEYCAQRGDELSFAVGEKLVVLRKTSDDEREWWWAQRADNEGYIARNLLGLFPRVMS